MPTSHQTKNYSAYRRAALDYFKNLSEEIGIPYQTLINLYLRECVVEGKQPSLAWTASG